jgi:hypothetical protein
MADEIVFTDARFATAFMMPVGDEEVNALWGRKMAWNDGRAIGAWGTGIATTVAGAHATFTVDISALGFNQFPSVDYYQYRGGSLAQQVTNASDTAGVFLGFYNVISGGTEFQFHIWGDAVNGTLTNFQNTATWQSDFGTILYRFRGW